MTRRRAWLAALAAAAARPTLPTGGAEPLASTAEAVLQRLLADPADRESWRRLVEQGPDHLRGSAAVALAALGGGLPPAAVAALPTALDAALRGPLAQRTAILADPPAGLLPGDRLALGLAVGAATGDLEAWHRSREELAARTADEVLPAALREALGGRLELLWQGLLAVWEADLAEALAHRDPRLVAAALEAQRQLARLLDRPARLLTVREAALRAARREWRESDPDRWRRGALALLVAWWAGGDLQERGDPAGRDPVNAALDTLPQAAAQCWTPLVTAAPPPGGPLPTWPWSLLLTPVSPCSPAADPRRWVLAWERQRAVRGCPEEGWQALLSGLLTWLGERAAALRQELAWRWREALAGQEVPRPAARS